MTESAYTAKRPSDDWLSQTSYWTPTELVDSAWHEHAPFAAWLINEQRPRTIVELGTHNGFSYLTWCECAVRLGLDTRLTAIDSWEGDDHAGHYGHEVFDAITAANRPYEDRSVLLRGFFSDRVADIEDGSVDLLHIDGRHGYEDVREDFELYLPKVSSRGIVLFHDVTEHLEGFGVFTFWAELIERYPSFTFQHGHGLGVLFVGDESAKEFASFLEAAKSHGDEIRANYELLGAQIEQRYLDHVSGMNEPGLVADLDEARVELHRIHHTRTWKLMAPARAIRARLGTR